MNRSNRPLAAVFAALLLGCTDDTGPVFGREDGGNAGDAALALDGGRCARGVDTDFDGADNAAECLANTDPTNADTDGDGIRDGAEINYARVCVAQDRSQQRRPVVACTNSTMCQLGETCRGLDPLARDSDGDEVADGQEDLLGDGRFDPGRGETDPRLWDTDGDGRPDSQTSTSICRRDNLVEPLRTPLVSGTFQLGLDPRWRDRVRTGEATSATVALLDDPTHRVAGLAIERSTTQTDVRMEAAAAETTLTSALTAVPILVGQTITTHEMLPAVNSLYRVASGDLGALRDTLRTRLAPGGNFAPSPSYGSATNVYVEITTVLRTDRGKATLLVTVIPAEAVTDPSTPTAIIADDFTNTTGLADADRVLDASCQRFTADRESAADFLWLVDTSGSMSDDQERLGRTAQRFFRDLDAAGVDFRVGVMQAGSMALDLDRPGFSFISGVDPGGARQLAWQVTYTTFNSETRDVFRPYPLAGGEEEPIAATVITYEALRARAQMGELDPNRRLRENAVTVAFFVTDEPGTNDDSRFFASNATRWGADYPTRLGRVVEFFRENNIQTFGLVADGRTNCATPNVTDFPKCAILNNGGAFIPITTATDAEVSAAMNRIVDAVAGATSQFRLDRTPISATLQVTVGGRTVPRSRADGFDYDAASRSVVFYGNSFRPRRGVEVVVSYRVWAGSLG
ncbi:MAG: VWA domain-containing protein [Myxococcales bacterium]|nr:VWA domain-containing protein [Myxococcales bacterium]